MAHTHYFPTDTVHFTWDTAHEPVITVAEGDTVVIETRDVSDNQISPDSDSSAIASLDWDRVYPLAGPIGVEGAAPGDTLIVEILDMRTRGWGWTAVLPGLGLLPEEFPDAYLRIFDIAGGDYAYMDDVAAIPLAPFLGTMGVCPAGASEVAVMPPGRFGGNMDTRQLVRGTTLFLPVEVEGAMFSTGDAHGCQGDGEVCVTGLEAPMYAVLRFGLEKGGNLPAPQFRTAPGPLTPDVDYGSFYGTTGVGPDLYAGAQDAVRAMIEHLTSITSLSPVDAYLLCSLCVDLKISEIVDAGQYIVSAVLPEAVLTRSVTRTIVAMGGATLRPEDYDPRLGAFLLALARRERPRVCFVGTASGDSPEYVANFYRAFSAHHDCEPSDLGLFERTVADLRAFVLAQDVIYVGGGNTASLLAVWRTHGLDAVLREAWEQGVVLCGVSAGMNCWFEASTTDSFDLSRLAGLRDGLGFLPGSACPHYDGEDQRRPLYRRLVAEEGFPPGYAADDAAALVFEGVALREVVTTASGSMGYRVDADGEVALAARLL